MDELTRTIRAYEGIDEGDLAEFFGIKDDPGRVILDPGCVIVCRRGEVIQIVFPNDRRLILEANHGG